MPATVRSLANSDDRDPPDAVVTATHQININGTWRDALFVHEIARRLYGSDERKYQQRVRALIANGDLFARSGGGNGGSYLIPVSAYAAYLRGEQYP